MKYLLILALFIITGLSAAAQNPAIEPVAWTLNEPQVESIMLGRPGWRVDQVIPATPESPTKIIMYLSEKEMITRSFGFKDGKLVASFLSFYTNEQVPAGESDTYADTRFKKLADNFWLDPVTHTHIKRLYDGVWIRYEMKNERWAEQMFKKPN